MPLLYRHLLAIFLMATLPSNALADEPADQPDDQLWKGEIEATYINLSGNTEETTSSVSLKAIRKSAPWRFVVSVDAMSSEDDEVRTAEKYDIFSRLDYNYTETRYVFGRVSYEEDHFSGYEYQGTVTVGLGRNIIKTELKKWDAEAGVGYRIAEVDEGSIEDDEKEAILRLSTAFLWKFADNARFIQMLTSEIGDLNTITKSETSLKIKIIGELAFKVSYKIEYTDEVPVGTEHTDTETELSLYFSF